MRLPDGHDVFAHGVHDTKFSKKKNNFNTQYQYSQNNASKIHQYSKNDQYRKNKCNTKY